MPFIFIITGVKTSKFLTVLRNYCHSWKRVMTRTNIVKSFDLFWDKFQHNHLWTSYLWQYLTIINRTSSISTAGCTKRSPRLWQLYCWYFQTHAEDFSQLDVVGHPPFELSTLLTQFLSSDLGNSIYVEITVDLWC